MNKEMQIFNNDEFGLVRMVMINDIIYFVGKDVTSILGYANASKALNDHVDDEDKLNNESLLSLGQRGGWIVNESGLYSLILSSKMPEAKKFKRWVTSEILPSIRRTGGYIPTNENDSDFDILARAVLIATRTIEEKDTLIQQQAKQLEEDKPKVLFAQTVEGADNTILVGDLAKILKGKGMDIGAKRLFAKLRSDGYLIKRSGSDYNAPTQKSMELGLFRIKETVINHIDGRKTVQITSKVTGKGQVYFINKFLGNEKLKPIIGQSNLYTLAFA